MAAENDLSLLFAIKAAFATTLHNYEHDAGPLGIQHDLNGIIAGVFGLDDRPQATPKFQFRQTP